MSPSSRTILYILMVVVSGGTLTTAQTRTQLIRFFTTANCVPQGTPPIHEYTISKNISGANDQPSSGFQSYCVLRGAWRVDLAYGGTPSRNDYNISIGDGCATCNSRGSGGRRYGHIQRISGADLTKATFSLFEEVDFGGREVLVSGWEQTFNETYSFSSLAFTSFNNWTWQTYYLPRFRGASTCHRPNLGTEITLITPSTVNVGSIRLGCRNSAKSVNIYGTGTTTIVIIAFAIATASVLL